MDIYIHIYILSYIYIYILPNTISLVYKQNLMGKWIEYEMNTCSYLNIYCSNGFYTYTNNLKQSVVLASPYSRTDKEDKIGYETDLSTKDTDIEINTDTSTWSTADKKKLQHMPEFLTEYECVFGEGASIRTIMKRRISHMNPPMPKVVCEEEM